jgi:hypothetical protein
MPTYEFRHDLEGCKYEWEEFLSMSAPNPTHCTKCGVEGNIIKLISGGSGRGIVELQGQELLDKCKADAKQLKKDAAKNENVYANLLGDDHYQALQTRIDNQKKDGKVKRR